LIYLAIRPTALTLHPFMKEIRQDFKEKIFDFA